MMKFLVKGILFSALLFLYSYAFALDEIPNPHTGELDIVYDKADEINIDDAGGYYTGTETETALQELGDGTTLDERYLKLDGTSTPTANIGFGDYNLTNMGELDLDLIRADAPNGSITIELDNAAGADLLVGNNNALVVEGDNDRVGIGVSAPEAVLHTNTRLSTNKGQLIRAVASQSASLFEIQDSNKTVLGIFDIGSVNSDGRLTVGSGTALLDGTLDVQFSVINEGNNNDALFGAAGFGNPSEAIFFGTHGRGTQSSPTETINGDVAFSLIGVGYTTNNTNAALDGSDGRISFIQDADSTATTAPMAITFKQGASTENMRLDSSGNLILGTTSIGTSSAFVLGIGNGTAPTSSPANMVQLYAEDVSASSELKVRDEAGNITTLSPHSADELNKLPADPAHEFPHIYKSTNAYLGKEIVIDITMLAYKIQELYPNEKIMTIRDIPKEDWNANQDLIEQQRNEKIIIAQRKIEAINKEISAEKNIKRKKYLIMRKKQIKVPEPYVKKPIPKWIAARINPS